MPYYGAFDIWLYQFPQGDIVGLYIDRCIRPMKLEVASLPACPLSTYTKFHYWLISITRDVIPEEIRHTHMSAYNFYGTIKKLLWMGFQWKLGANWKLILILCSMVQWTLLNPIGVAGWLKLINCLPYKIKDYLVTMEHCKLYSKWDNGTEWNGTNQGAHSMQNLLINNYG